MNCWTQSVVSYSACASVISRTYFLTMIVENSMVWFLIMVAYAGTLSYGMTRMLFNEGPPLLIACIFNIIWKKSSLSLNDFLRVRGNTLILNRESSKSFLYLLHRIEKKIKALGDNKVSKSLNKLTKLKNLLIHQHLHFDRLLNYLIIQLLFL